MNTLLLDTVEWDLVLDAASNIAVASSPYSLAQDAASAILTFRGEVYWDKTIGIPYLSDILAKRPSIALLKATFAEEAATVPDVARAEAFITSIADRVCRGQVQVFPAGGGAPAAATFAVANPQGVG